MLVAITLTDLDLRMIPNTVVLAGAGRRRSRSSPRPTPITLPENLAAGAIAGGVLFLVALAYPRGMGMGDVKLVAMMGLYLGRAVAPGAADRLRCRRRRRASR